MIIGIECSNHTIIPNYIVRSNALSHGAKLCYGRLLAHKRERGEIHITHRELSEELGLSREMTGKLIKELIRHDFITVEPRKIRNIPLTYNLNQQGVDK
jgi:CRP-like cAMP-binding protein